MNLKIQCQFKQTQLKDYGYYSNKLNIFFVKLMYIFIILSLQQKSWQISLSAFLYRLYMSSEKVQSPKMNHFPHAVLKQEQKQQVLLEQPLPQSKNLSQSELKDLQSSVKQQIRSQNPKIGRPAKTDQQQQFKKCYLQNKQKFELQCELLVFIHQNYFDQIIDNPINTRVSKQYMDRLFVANGCQQIYRTLLKLNENYFKNSSYYPQDKLKYTSLIDIAYMCNAIKQQHGDKLSSMQMLLIIFFYLYNEKLVNQNFYEYFIKNLQKFREGMIFGPGGKQGPKLEKLDKLIICLALTLADLQKILIEEEVLYSQEEFSGSQSQNDDDGVRKIYQSKRTAEQAQLPNHIKPKKKIHEDR